MRRLLTTGAVLAAFAGAAATEASAQSPLVNLGFEYTPAFVGDDFEGLEGGIGFHGGLLFPVGPMSYIGADVGWTGVDFEDAADDADASILDVMGVVQVGLGVGESIRPYVDIRAGYSRLAFELATLDGDISGPAAGGGLGARFTPAGIWIDVLARYEHHWFGEFDEDGLIFQNESSGGRVVLGAGISIPFGGM